MPINDPSIPTWKLAVGGGAVWIILLLATLGVVSLVGQAFNPSRQEGAVAYEPTEITKDLRRITHDLNRILVELEAIERERVADSLLTREQ